MAAIERRIKEDADSFFNFAKDGFKYNLQVLPDVFMSATLLFSVLFQSPPMVVLGVSMIALQFIHQGLSAFTRAYLPNMTYNPADYTRCSGRFPGATYSSLFTATREGIFQARPDGWPSYYATFIGFLTGWIGTLPTLYEKELAASPEKHAASTAGLIILGLFVILVIMYRVLSECEGFMSTALGLLAGFVIGVGIVLLVSWISDKRATNILGLPLIRNKAAAGQPIYVCERGAETATA